MSRAPLLLSVLLAFSARPLPAQEVTFSWTGGFDNWNTGSRWQTSTGTGMIPNTNLHYAKIGENAIGRVELNTPNQFVGLGRLRIEQGSTLDVSAGQLELNAGGSIDSPGRIAGKGEILIRQATAGVFSRLFFEGGEVRLDNGADALLSGGVIRLDILDTTRTNFLSGLTGRSAGPLTNHDWLIAGHGFVSGFPFRQRPYGVLRADAAGKTLSLESAIPLNLGTLEADGGMLHLAGSYYAETAQIRQWLAGDSSTGTIRAKNNGRVLITQRDVEGGTLENLSTPSNLQGRIIAKDYVKLIGTAAQPLTIRGRIDLEDDLNIAGGNFSRLYANLKGPIHNLGEIHVIGGDPSQRSYPGALTFGASPGEGCRLTGGGRVVIETVNRDFFIVNGPDIATDALVNVDNQIEMHGRYEGPLINETAGTFTVNQPGKVLEMGISRETSLINRGILSATNGGILSLGGRTVQRFTPDTGGFRNTDGNVVVTGDGTANSSQVLFRASGEMFGGRILNSNGRVIINLPVPDTVAYSWPRHSFHGVTFEGNAPQGTVEVQPGLNAVWLSCILKGEARVTGGTISLGVSSSPGAVFLGGNGTIRLAAGIIPANGQTVAGALLTTGDRRNTTVEVDLHTSCLIKGSGQVQARNIFLIGGTGGIVADEPGKTLDLGGLKAVQGGSLQAQQGGKVLITPPAGGMKLPPRGVSGAAGIGSVIQIKGGQPLLANDGASLLANDGASLIANDGSSLIANDGGSLIANDGASLIANDGGSLIANDGGSLIANDGGSLIANDGGSLVAKLGGLLIANDGASLIAGNRASILSDQGGGIAGTSRASFLLGSTAALAASARVPREVNTSALIVKNGGLLAPSRSLNGTVPLHGYAGQLNITGRTIIEPGGLLQSEIGGPLPDTGYDQTIVTGPVTFAGKLDVRILNSYVSQLTPALRFTVLTSSDGITGTPENVSASRISTSDGLGSFRFTGNATSYVLDDFQPTPGLAENFAAFVLANTLSGPPGDDRDEDGLTDFAEYAFGTNPLASDSAPAAGVETLFGQKWLVVHYRLRAARTLAGLTLIPQQSPDLQSWSRDGIIDEPDPAAPVIPNTESRRARIPLPATGRAWLRLRAATQ